MENNTGSCNMCDTNCKCVACDMSHSKYNRHHMYMVRRFFILALLIVVFCFGVQLGQLRSMSHMYRGSYGMMKWDGNKEYSGKMMKTQVNDQEAVPAEAAQ